MDFTLEVYDSLLTILLDTGYQIMSVSDFSEKNKPDVGRQLILRHDVDRHPKRSLATAVIERNKGIVGTYYFRVTPGSFDIEIIREIASMGHEIGYHYEDLYLVSRKSKDSLLSQSFGGQDDRNSSSFVAVEGTKGEKQNSHSKEERYLVAMAYNSFGENLSRLRELAPVKTICMHGSPMSGYDSRRLWKYFNYSELGIETEPYFDLSLDSMLYLTDTGRRWNGSTVSIRDRVYVRDESYYEGWVRKPVAGSAMAMTKTGEELQSQFRYRKTATIIRDLRTNSLPQKLFVTVHPQRWSNSVPVWFLQMVTQKVKNGVKYLINRKYFGSGN